MFFALFVVTILVWILPSRSSVDRNGVPIGGDFITFYAASKSAISGHAELAYDPSQLFKLERAVVGASGYMFAWFYPPAFFLLIFPLALMPYGIALAASLFVSFSLCVLVLWRITKRTEALWLLAGFSGVMVNLINGQNGFLTAAAAGAAMVCFPRRPLLAGIFIGVLSVKPQLAVLFPIALIAINAWSALGSAVLSAVALSGLAYLFFGLQTLRAFLGSLTMAKRLLEQGALPWRKMPTMFAFLRTCGAPLSVAYLGQIVVAMVALLSVVYVWRRSSDWQLRAAALLTGTLLVSPYLFDYDLVWLGFPIAWITLIGIEDGWLQGEREVLCLAWLLPLLMAPASSTLTVQPAVFGIMALLFVVVRRVVSVRPGAHSKRGETVGQIGLAF